MIRITKSVKMILVIFIGACLISCAGPYYGYSKSDWEKLTEEEQNAAKAEYDAIIAEKNVQRHKDTLDDMKQNVIDRGVGLP